MSGPRSRSFSGSLPPRERGVWAGERQALGTGEDANDPLIASTRHWSCRSCSYCSIWRPHHGRVASSHSGAPPLAPRRSRPGRLHCRGNPARAPSSFLSIRGLTDRYCCSDNRRRLVRSVSRRGELSIAPRGSHSRNFDHIHDRRFAKWGSGAFEPNWISVTLPQFS